MKMLRNLFALAALAVATASAQANFINGNFETGTFAGWTTTGITGVVGTFSNVPPPGGAFQGAAQTNGGVAVAGLETFFGLAPGSIAASTGVGTPTNGSGFQQTITIQTGDRLTFSWEFVTNEGFGDPTFNDAAFVVIANTSTGLANTFSLVGFNGALNTTGPQSFEFVFPTEGTYNVGVGVVNKGDTTFNSFILADNFTISTPVPPTAYMGLVAAGFAGLGYGRRRFLR
jgi:plastocyanin